MKKIVLIWLYLAVFASDIWAGVRYSITDLGSVASGSIGHLYDINDNGDVVGSRSNGSAYIYRDGSFETLVFPGASNIFARGINNKGQVVGEADGDIFIYEAGQYTKITSYSRNPAYAFEINDNGQVTWTHTDDRFLDAFMYQDGDTICISDPKESRLDYIPISINERGQVLVTGGNGNSGDYIYDNGNYEYISRFTYPRDLNNNGMAVGVHNCDYRDTLKAYSTAFVYQDRQLILLETPDNYNSVATACNDSGDIVGQLFDLDTSLTSAAIYEDDSFVMLDDLIPADSGWHLEYAVEMNNAGQIVGVGDINGESRGYLLTPIPETCSVVLFGGGWLVLSKRRIYSRD